MTLDQLKEHYQDAVAATGDDDLSLCCYVSAEDDFGASTYSHNVTQADVIVFLCNVARDWEIDPDALASAIRQHLCEAERLAA